MTGRQQKALAALIRAPTRAEAAAEAGVGVSTLRRWMKEDVEFQTAYREALTELLEDAAAQGKQNISRALDVLAKIMEDGENSQVKVSAARTALEYSLKLSEQVDVLTRIAAIENVIGGNNG